MKSMNIMKSIKELLNKANTSNDNSIKEDIANKYGFIRTGAVTKSNKHIPKLEYQNIETDIVDISPNLYLVHRAARICVGLGPLDGIDNKIKHIERMMTMGHESILEHSNIISMIRIKDNTMCLCELSFAVDIIKLLSESKFLNICVNNLGGYTNILIGGSIRAYLHILRETDPNNQVVYLIEDIMEKSIEKVFLKPMIDIGALEDDECNYLPHSTIKEYDENSDDSQSDCDMAIEPKEVKGDIVDLVYSQPTEKIYSYLHEYGFSIDDVMKVCTISFIFHDVSRSCANQMTRHRVGISQESQRYCKHTTDKDTDFVNPIILTQDRYDGISDDIIKQCTEYDPFNEYKYLLSNGILKEDARAWLPMNVTTKLMMTFTYKQLFHFYKLRSGKGAQMEVQMVASEIKKYIDSILGSWVTSIDSLIDSSLEYDIMKTPDPNNSHEEPLTETDVDESQIVEEEMKSINIDNLEAAEKYIKTNEEYKNL